MSCSALTQVDHLLKDLDNLSVVRINEPIKVGSKNDKLIETSGYSSNNDCNNDCINKCSPEEPCCVWNGNMYRFRSATAGIEDVLRELKMISGVVGMPGSWKKRGVGGGVRRGEDLENWGNGVAVVDNGCNDMASLEHYIDEMTKDTVQGKIEF